MVLRFSVPGRPKAKARPRKGQHGNFYTPRSTGDAEDEIGWAARKAGAKPTMDPVRLDVSLYMRKLKRNPDGDNVCKLVADALNGVAYVDDAQVVRWSVALHWVEDKRDERTEIEVRSA